MSCLLIRDNNSIPQEETMKHVYSPLILIIVGIFCLLPPTACEKQKRFTVGIINPNPGTKEIQNAFMKALSTHAQNQGSKLQFILCTRKKSLDEDLEKLIEQEPDLLFTVTTPATKKAIQKVRGMDIPVIFAMYDPVGSGVIKSLLKPGGNYSGIQLGGSAGKGLEWLLTLAPKIKNIFVPIKFDTKAASQSLADLQKTADIMGVRLIIAELKTQDELEQSLASIPEVVDAIFLLHSILISSNVEKISAEAVWKKLPSGAASNLAAKGILVSFGINYNRIGKQASHLAAQVLGGESAADVPSEIAYFSLGINLHTASQIDLSIPDQIILQADEVVKKDDALQAPRKKLQL